MTDQSEHAQQKTLRFVPLSTAALNALAEGDLVQGSAEAGVDLGDFFATDTARWVWRHRLGQLAERPGIEGWLTHAVVDEAADGAAVGYAGFHGPPDETGMVELGYSVVPDRRRQGYARAMLTDLVRRAATEQDVRTIRVTISPDNTASRATIAGFGFEEVGEQWDEEDGLETIYEIPANRDTA
ncbi:GNAT family N-acetyltransferase [Streptomyces sp. NPDC058001]|uniref:GNAT family N-acetyltransferase n=1 Tax=Streptomyces sp. NPDC058001 TaxID=3346300 RepID=UPI0036E78AC3